MTKRILILGAGGHAQVVADAMHCARSVGYTGNPIGYLDDRPELRGKIFNGLPVLGGIGDLSNVDYDELFVAIGHNLTRQKVFDRMRRRGAHFTTVIHPSAIIARDVIIGSGTVICAGVVVNTGAEIGSNVILNTSCSVGHHDRVSAHAHVAPGSRLAGEVLVGEGAFVGIGAVVIPQCRIGDWSIVGAGAAVITDVPERWVVGGVPAKPIRSSKNHA
jgi:sugar O-acyltransferase (sialic acid O-acetyltransferase NeuD family)